MPQVIIDHSIVLDETDKDALKKELRKLCAKIFSTFDDVVVESINLGPEDFSFKFIDIPVGDQTNDVIVRIHLHETDDRLARSETNTALIKTLVLVVFAEHARPNMSVGVSLSYGMVHWDAGRTEEITRADLYALDLALEQ